MRDDEFLVKCKNIDFSIIVDRERNLETIRSQIKKNNRCLVLLWYGKIKHISALSWLSIFYK